MRLISLACVLLLGILEGITEWLPISSTGHLILLGDRLPLSMTPQFREFFDVAIQLGAILAVLFLYWKELHPLCRENLRLWQRILLAALPSAVVGLLLDEWIFSHFFNPVTVAVSLILWGVAFLLSERLPRLHSPTYDRADTLSLKVALGIGVWQIFALIPGTSRSGATILGARILGCTKETAARFSFFLAIPTMLGASLLKGSRFVLEGNLPTSEELLLLAVGSATAFLVSLVSLRFLTDFVRRHGFSSFGVYRILLGLLVLSDYFL